MALINNNTVYIRPISAIKTPQNRVIIIKDTEVTIRVTEVTSPDTTVAVSIWENTTW